MSHMRFIQLTLKDSGGKLLSQNFYWRGAADRPDDLSALDSLKTANLEVNAARQGPGNSQITATLHNPGTQIALMAHVQLRRGKPADPNAERVLPVFYSDNYISLVPGESRTITIDAAAADLKGDAPFITVDGWNIGLQNSSSSPIPVMLNINAQVDHWPVTNLPMVAHTWK
jgi:hypothetical protein